MDEDAAPALDEVIASFSCWVYDPHTLMRARGFMTGKLVVAHQHLVVEPIRLPRFVVTLPRVDYTWPAVVVQRRVWSYRLNHPSNTTLLLDVGGELGSVAVGYGQADRLRWALGAAGFEIVEDTVRGWETPQPLRIRDHPGLVGRLPESVLVERSWFPERPAGVRRNA